MDVYGVQTSCGLILQFAFVAVPETENGVLEGYLCRLTRRRVSRFREQRRKVLKELNMGLEQ